MKQKKILVTTVIALLLIGLITITSYTILNKETNQKQNKEFYVGVTYCGNSTQEAKELIDKVKDYTNLFILQSGSLMRNITEINEIGDYVCASNLNYALYGSRANTYGGDIGWIFEAKERWGEQFIGIYYNDEPGGKMLDGLVYLENTMHSDTMNIDDTQTTIQKHEDGTITSYYVNPKEGVSAIHNRYYSDGRITIIKSYPTETIVQESNSSAEEKHPSSDTTEESYKSRMDTFDYYPNGTITIEENTYWYTIQKNTTNNGTTSQNSIIADETNINFYTSESNITEYPSPIPLYEQVLKQNPVQTHDDAAEAYINRMNKNPREYINKTQLNEKSILFFTADYGLYWWDYQSGYDIILAELGWNNSITQEIALVRGAANLQNKSWGTCITWKYTHAPYLTDGEEMFEQMKTSYQAGAEYIIIFNYSENQENPNTLQEEHFQALERFWNDTVQNPKVTHGGVKTDAVLVLPQNYGWGMRHPNDHIWGIWRPDDTSKEIWNQLQDKQSKHGLKLDIVFEDPNYPVTGKYANIYYWNQK